MSSRYERARHRHQNNKEFGRWGEFFADDTVAAAMIDRLVHHADVVALKGDSYRLKNHDLGRIPATAAGRLTMTTRQGVRFQPPPKGSEFGLWH